MTQARFHRSRISTIGLILSQAFSLNFLSLNAFAQNPNGAARPALPIPMSTSTLIGIGKAGLAALLGFWAKAFNDKKLRLNAWLRIKPIALIWGRRKRFWVI